MFLLGTGKKKGRSYYTCAGLNCRCCRNFIHSYFLRRRNHCTTRRFLSSQDPDKTAEPGVVVSFLGNSRIVIQRIYIFVSSYCTISLGEIILPTRFWTRCFFVLWFTNFLSKWSWEAAVTFFTIDLSEFTPSGKAFNLLFPCLWNFYVWSKEICSRKDMQKLLKDFILDVSESSWHHYQEKISTRERIFK